MPGLLNDLPNPNFGGYVSPWLTTSNDANPGEPIYTELAKSFMPLEGRTPLSELFPDEEISERIVKIEQKFQAGDTIFPLVEMGKPDVVLGHNYGTTRSFFVQPLYIRRSTFISYGEINTKLKPGTLNDKWSPQEQIAMITQGMVREHNLTWDVFRAMMLLGGIQYTDPRTGVPARVAANIPAHNVWHYGVTSGYRGRNESNLFRGLIDYNTPQPSTAGIPWTDPDADIVGCVQKFARWFKETNKAKITGMYMSPELREVIATNNEIKLQTGGLIAKMGAVTGDKKVYEAGLGGGGYMVDGNVLDRMMVGAIGIGPDGVIALAGIPIYTVETMYRDPVDGIYKRVWPKNKVVFVATTDVNGGSEPIGRTQFCVSEESGGAPGLWTRTQDQTQIPAAPGMYMQMGNAGMPYLKYPYRVAHMTVATVDDINTRLGVLGDIQFGTF
jgi:hypothetical protein